MLLGEPNHTPYDLHFSVLGFPVRVHPLFWVMGLIMGFQSPMLLLIATSVAFVSILIHELGHALMMRRFGRESHIVLYMMGGLAIEGSGSSFSAFSSRSYGRRTTYEQILISAAGPGAGFLLAGAVIAVLYGMGGSVEWVGDIIPTPRAHLGANPAIARQNYNLLVLFDYLLWFNIVWGAVNLLPVFPLDGGQIAQAALVAKDPWHGLVRSLWLSVITGGIAAVVGGLLQSLYMVLLFGSLAYSSYVALQQVSGGRGRPW